MSAIEIYDVENLRQLNRRQIQHLAKVGDPPRHGLYKNLNPNRKTG
jgi:hypothetical protein